MTSLGPNRNSPALVAGSWPATGATDAKLSASTPLRDSTTRNRQEERLAKINECLLSFGNDSLDNINRLTALCGELLGGAWALYSHLEGDILHAISGWQTPPNLPLAGKPDGHICSDVIARGGHDVFVVRNLPQTSYAQTDPGVLTYGLQTYVGKAVKRDGRYIGSLCVVYQHDYVPSDDDQKVMGIIASAIGVEEERRRAGEALRNAYEENERILGSMPGAILALNEDQQVVYANSLAYKFFGAGRESLVGMAVADVLPLKESRRSQLIQNLSPYSAECGSWMQDREFEAGDRAYRYRLFPITLRGSERPQTGFVIWDITEEKQLQARLIQTEKLASLGTMVSGMAHEINNPLQAILGTAEAVVDEDSPETMKEHIRDIMGYARHIAGVVLEFASYSRSATHDKDIEMDLTTRLTDAIKMIRRGPHFGQVEVVTQFQPIPSIRARRSEIDQVFINLIGNAVQAMAGTGTLTLATCMRGGMIAVQISDTGCGIPKAALPQIFDPFYTTKDPGKGTGLGLNIVQKIVAKYGGKIAVESEEQKGTTFTITFPAELSS